MDNDASTTKSAPRLLWPLWRDDWIVHRDADLIVVDKPVGVPTHAPDEGRVDDAHARLGAFLRAQGEANPYLGIHQRLDRDTSGVLLFTRRKEANRAIAEQFEGRHVEKVYVAGVVGKLSNAGRLEHRLAPGKDGAMIVLPAHARGGQAAVSTFKVLARKGHRALVEVRPETGRTHQIRVQLAAAGAPIAGDDLYRGEPASRLMLHARELRLKHPSSGKPTTFVAPVPPVLKAWLEGGATSPLESVDAIERAMRAAALLRYGVACREDTTAFRIVNGAGDGLPGVTVDVYGEHLVVGLLGDEAEAARERVLDAADRLGFKGVYVKVRPKHASVVVDTRTDRFAPRDAVRGESAPEAFTVLELGLPIRVRLGDGLSTGVFLDQRENRRRVRELSRGLRVLNLFAYTGAFTAAAIAGGARSSVTVDVARNALAVARENFDALSADAKAHELVEADVFSWIERAAKKGGKFDLVLLDPPSFATTKKSRFSAASDYRALAAQTLSIVTPGGKLLACTNHKGIPRLKFRRFLHEAARDAGLEVEQMKDLPDPEDFPPEPGHEAHLKSVLVTLRQPAPAAKPVNAKKRR